MKLRPEFAVSGRTALTGMLVLCLASAVAERCFSIEADGVTGNATWEVDAIAHRLRRSSAQNERGLSV